MTRLEKIYSILDRIKKFGQVKLTDVNFLLDAMKKLDIDQQIDIIKKYRNTYIDEMIIQHETLIKNKSVLNYVLSSESISYDMVRKIIQYYPLSVIDDSKIELYSASREFLLLLIENNYRFPKNFSIYVSLFYDFYDDVDIMNENIDYLNPLNPTIKLYSDTLKKVCDYLSQTINYDKHMKIIKNSIDNLSPHNLINLDDSFDHNQTKDLYLKILFEVLTTHLCIDIFKFKILLQYIPYFFSNRYKKTIAYLLSIGLCDDHLKYIDKHNNVYVSNITKMMELNGISDNKIRILIGLLCSHMK